MVGFCPSCWRCMGWRTPGREGAAHERHLPPCSLGLLAVTLAVWLGWSLLTPVNLRLAKAAFAQLGAAGDGGHDRATAVAWVLCRALRLAPGFYPVLAGLMAAVPVGALYWFSPSSLMLPGYGVVIAVVGTACLSMPTIWRRAGDRCLRSFA